MIDLDKMLELCTTRQWQSAELDWTGQPRPMTRQEEINIVQFFTNMAGVERLAKALFAEHQKRAETEQLGTIFASFVGDEERHACVAEQLADYYNVHGYKDYAIDKELLRFRSAFVKAVQHVSPEVANAYTTAGELMLDVALLRSVHDYVDDPMSTRVMENINKDEARHVAMDYHMTEYYASPEYRAKLDSQPAPSMRERARTAWHVGNMLLHARPFLQKVFLDPMQIADPEGDRLKEAFKRMQLLTRKPEVARRPFPRLMNGMRDMYNTPIVGSVFGGVLSRAVGAPSRYLVDLYDDDEEKAAMKMSINDMAKEATAA